MKPGKNEIGISDLDFPFNHCFAFLGGLGAHGGSIMSCFSWHLGG
jgi:hypothetical protein